MIRFGRRRDRRAPAALAQKTPTFIFTLAAALFLSAALCAGSTAVPALGQQAGAPAGGAADARKAEGAGDAAFRVSQASASGADRDAGSPDVAYNADDNEYMVVWEANGLSGEEFRRVREVFGQRINAATGAEVGPDILISRMSDGGQSRSANDPQVVYNSTAREYLIVWHGSGAAGDPDSVFEVYGRKLSRTGAEVGKEFRISRTTDTGRIQETIVRSAARADVAWNSTNNQYLVVWEGMGQPGEEIKVEVYGQLLSAAGEAVGKNFRISNVTDQGQGFNAGGPDVAYNPKNNQYLVAWAGGYKEKNQSEVWAQGLTAQGAQVGQGTGDFLVSQVTTKVGSNRDAGAASVAYDEADNEYLVAFQATGVPGAAGENVNEVFGQRINAATLKEVGPDDFRISNTPVAKDAADNPRAAYDGAGKGYVVIWRGVRNVGPYEIFGQRLSAAGAEIGSDFQISNIAAVGQDRKANLASVACGPKSGECLAVWQGDGLPGPAGKRVNEIFGIRLKPQRRP